MIQEKKESPRKVPFFARYLVGQQTSPEARDRRASKATLKYPSDWDEWDRHV